MLIKFCGLQSPSEIELAAQLKVDFYGVIFHKKSPRYVEPAQARHFPKVDVKRVGVFTSSDLKAIIEVFELAKLDMAQLHADQPIQLAREIGAENVIRVMWPMRYNSVEALQQDAQKFADNCAYYLLDAGMGGGGNGLSISWQKLRSLQLPHPWILAGGLSPENVADAISQCHPSGVDMNSGIENAAGRKMPDKMKAAIMAINKN